MKKYWVAALCVGMAFNSYAQKSNIRAAETYLEDGNLEKAKTAIDAAVIDESTKDNVRAWYVRGAVYLTMQQKSANASFYNEAAASFKKTIALEPGYQSTDVNNKLFATAIYSFNAGLDAYNKQKFDESYKSFGEVAAIYNIGDGKRFSSMKRFDTAAHQSNLYQGYSAYYNNKFDDAFPLLMKAKNDPVVKNANIYIMLADIYKERKDTKSLEELIQEAKKVYPNEKSIATLELNYYIESGKTEELVKKLETAIAAEPNNADLQYMAGQKYDEMANPKDAKGNDKPKPADYNSFFTKAETAYKNALGIKPDNAGYNFNYGALYFNRGVYVNQQIDKIEGNTAEDMKKYDALKKERDGWFAKALPSLEKAIDLWEPTSKTLKGDDFNAYQAAILAASKIYAIQNNGEKVKALRAKLEAFQKG